MDNQALTDLAYLTLAQAAQRIGVSVPTLRRRILAGTLPAILFAGKYLIRPTDLEALITGKREVVA